MVRDVRPHQCTLVPVRAGEITSQAGWPSDTPRDELRGIVQDLQSRGIRVSLFVEAERPAVEWAASIGAARVELYTEPFAQAFKAGEAQAEASFRRYIEAANVAHALGLGVNAGHDLDLDNLVLFRTLPHLDEVSIGHALISHALYVGLDRAVRDYIRASAAAL
jgi:pyridoxine 5-phosphate synthase